VRHLLRALGVSGRVRSPTYTVLEPYQVGALEISHFDFYRFSDPREWEDAGFREVFGRPGLKLVEWASRAGELLPPPDLRLTLEPGLQDERQVRAEALSPVGLQLLRALREAARPELQGDKGRDDGPGGGGEHTPQAAPG
jgi:tRNA threonylcarbamoyladenosine biosynthesis protein TsaE